VTVIDDDLGRSGSGTVERPGFERLVAMVCLGDIGAVYCIDASRLARNRRDWHHLIELCAVAGTLVVDPEGAYDPRIVNDRLLLGLKGTMSEYELSLMRQRGLAARDSKARRGEFRFMLPRGFCWGEAGKIEIDPDEHVQEAVRMARQVPRTRQRTTGLPLVPGASDQIERLTNDVIAAAERDLEAAHYEASLAARRHELVDPAKRFVARELEARWNGALERVAEIERRIEDLRATVAARPKIDRAALMRLAQDLPAAWNAPTADTRTRSSATSTRPPTRSCRYPLDRWSATARFVCHE
jgi:hypothetical protein